MKPIDRGEILGIVDYESVRPHFRARVIEEKRPRRVKVSDHLTAVFENRDSVMLQIQEMLRTERITAEPAILHEVETYNELIPGEDELSITLFVEVENREERDRVLVLLAGLEDHLGLEIDGEVFSVRGKRPEAVPERTTAVHYLKVHIGPSAAEKLRASRARAAIVVTHPKYAARADFGPATLAKLAEDLSQ